jgi:hypothetical protein
MGGDMKPIINWRELVDKESEFHELGDWVFRGQSTPKHRIRSTLERACEDFDVPKDDIPAVEKAILADFKRGCGNFGVSLPDDDDTLRWLSLMRHYGAPCRFVDFTYSFFIAAYFAVEAEDATPVVWAVDRLWLAKNTQSLILPLPNGADLLKDCQNDWELCSTGSFSIAIHRLI